MGRRMRRWTQAHFAGLMLAVDPDGNWTYAKVSKAERGEQSIDAEVLALIARVQGLDISWYYQLPYDGGSPEPWGSRAMGPYLISHDLRPAAKVLEVDFVNRRAQSPIHAAR